MLGVNAARTAVATAMQATATSAWVAACLGCLAMRRRMKSFKFTPARILPERDCMSMGAMAYAAGVGLISGASLSSYRDVPDRRLFLQRSAALGGLGLLGGCATTGQ